MRKVLFVSYALAAALAGVGYSSSSSVAAAAGFKAPLPKIESAVQKVNHRPRYWWPGYYPYYPYAAYAPYYYAAPPIAYAPPVVYYPGPRYYPGPAVYAPRVYVGRPYRDYYYEGW